MNAVPINNKMKTNTTGKRNHLICLLQNEGIETSSWMKSLVFFAGNIWGL